MREIKFRAWFEGHMYEIAKLDFWGDPDQATCDMARNSLTEYGNVEEIYEVYLHEVELMQYTGLKDKNGKEIYEGDIVSFEDSDGGYEYQDVVINTGIVEYGELGFYFTNRVAVEMDDFYIKDGRCDEIEVIGNIYDNPELLEG
jgi:uncharacterized phage protein (TIGR01671 family)